MLDHLVVRNQALLQCYSKRLFELLISFFLLLDNADPSWISILIIVYFAKWLRLSQVCVFDAADDGSQLILVLEEIELAMKECVTLVCHHLFLGEHLLFFELLLSQLVVADKVGYVIFLAPLKHVWRFFFSIEIICVSFASLELEHRRPILLLDLNLQLKRCFLPLMTRVTTLVLRLTMIIEHCRGVL